MDRVLRSFVQFLKGENIKWFTDNANVVSIVQKGSMKNNLQDLAMNIFQICLEYKISIEIEWIPRELNEQADYLSRTVDFDDWGIVKTVFDDLSREWFRMILIY